MEDIKALCKRSIVVNHGMKIYDGKTEELFEKYQVSKKPSDTLTITVN
jgi:ABC-2 type transport system ATP-binding protein